MIEMMTLANVFRLWHEKSPLEVGRIVGCGVCRSGYLVLLLGIGCGFVGWSSLSRTYYLCATMAAQLEAFLALVAMSGMEEFV